MYILYIYILYIIYLYIILCVCDVRIANINTFKGVRGLLSIQCIKIGDIFFLCILTNFKMFSAPSVLIRFQLCKLHIVNQYNVNKTCLFKKKMVH